jgi:hypothetical protein
VNDRWALRPFAHYGWGKEMDGGESARIWFYGINSRYTFFDKGDLEIDLLNGLQWFAYSTNDNVSDRFSRLVTGVEGMYPLRCWSIYGYPLYLKPHIIHFWYFDDLGFNQILQPWGPRKRSTWQYFRWIALVWATVWATIRGVFVSSSAPHSIRAT